MSSIVTDGPVRDTTGQYKLDPDALPFTTTRNGPGGVIDSVTVGPDYLGYTYKYTITFSGGFVTGGTGWVKQ